MQREITRNINHFWMIINIKSQTPWGDWKGTKLTWIPCVAANAQCLAISAATMRVGETWEYLQTKGVRCVPVFAG